MLGTRKVDALETCSIADREEFEKNVPSDVHEKRLKYREGHIDICGGKVSVPCADGLIKQEGHVESLTESLTQQQFPEQRFLEDVDCDDAALEEMLYNAHREHVYHSHREGLSVGQSSSSVSERTVRPVVERTGTPVVERGQEVNTEHAQIRTLLDPQKEQILAECQAETKKHQFQAGYDRTSIQKLNGIIESQQEELHRAQAEELHRRDQQLLHEQLLEQNSELREAHEKSLKEMEELKKFQSSTFDTIARRKLVED